MTLTITDTYPVTVTVNGTPVELTEGRLVLQPAEGTQLVTATDPAGNESRLEITVNDGHTWGDWSSNGRRHPHPHLHHLRLRRSGNRELHRRRGHLRGRAVCEVCGGAYGDVDAHRHADLRYVEAKAATTEAPATSSTGTAPPAAKYFADAQASRELRQADTVTEQLPATPTGDEAPLALWVIVLAACAGLALLLLVLRRRTATAPHNGGSLLAAIYLRIKNREAAHPGRLPVFSVQNTIDGRGQAWLCRQRSAYPASNPLTISHAEQNTVPLSRFCACR